MKYFFLLAYLVIGKVSTSQELPYKDGDIVYEITVVNRNLSKNDLFDNTLSFLDNTFNKKSVFFFF